MFLILNQLYGVFLKEIELYQGLSTLGIIVVEAGMKSGSLVTS